MIVPTRQSQIDGLRQLADYLADHPGVPMPYLCQFDAFVATLDELADAARAMGGADKVASGEWFYLRRTFAGGVTLHVNIMRSKICERVKVGERTVTRPAVEAQPERIETEDVYDYVCPDSILGQSTGG